MSSRLSVRTTFETIADHFAETRQNPWPEVVAFVESVETARVALDVGCGNGRHAELLAGVADDVLGVDASRRLLALACERVPESGFVPVAGDAARLPVAASTVEVAVYVATIHHLPTRAGRIGSLDELARVLRADGRALVSTWSSTHDRFDREGSFDTTVDWTLPDGRTLERFYHIYSPDGFCEDLAASDLAVLDFEVVSGNCYAEVAPEEKRP